MKHKSELIRTTRKQKKRELLQIVKGLFTKKKK